MLQIYLLLYSDSFMSKVQKIEHSHNVGKIGTALTILCTVHCVATPFLALFIPFLSNENGTHWTEIALILTAGFIGISGLLHGYKYHHQNAKPLIFFIIGLVFFVAGIGFSFTAFLHEMHSPMMIIGGLVTASSQIVNLRMSHSSGSVSSEL